MDFETTSDVTVISFYHSAPKNAPRDLLNCLKKNGLNGAIAIKEIGERKCTDIRIPMGQDKLEEAIQEIEADNERWDVLMATDKAQSLLEKMAGEALVEHPTSKTKPVEFQNTLTNE